MMKIFPFFPGVPSMKRFLTLLTPTGSLMLFILLAVSASAIHAQNRPRYGTGLPATGSDKGAFTIYTNPAEDCSTAVNISWGSPVGSECKIKLTNVNTSQRRVFTRSDSAFIAPREDIFFVVTPSSDNNRGRDLKPVTANKDIIAKRWSEGSKTVGGMLMDVNPERIVMSLYDRNGIEQDSFTVPAKR